MANVNWDFTGITVTRTFTFPDATGTILLDTGSANVITVGTVTTGTWHATKIGLAYGGTNADLSATGGTSQVLKQATSGAAITVGQLAASDLSDGVTGSGGAVVLATGPTLSNPVVGTQSAGDASTKAASTAFVQAAKGAWYGTTADVANTYTATITGATLNAGNLFAILFAHHPTGAATLNINGLGAKAIVLPTGAAIAGAQGADNQLALMVYDGTSFVYVVQPNNA